MLKKQSRRLGKKRFFRPLVEALEDRCLLAAVITVNSTADTNARDTALTFREAILVNNRTLAIATLSAAEQAQVAGTPASNDADTIQFNIAGTGVQTISPTSGLPNITEAVTINGYSQPGAAANTNEPDEGLNTVLQIELAGNNAGGGAIGLRLAAGSGGSTIRGLAINRFAAQGIQIDTSGNTIAGNFIGTNAAGTAALANADNGVIIFSGSNNVIGGTASADRNLLSGNEDNGVALVFAAANGNIIQGNLLGTDLTGTQDVGNAFMGIYSFQAVNTVIGGTTPGAGNLISGNNIDGIQFQGGSNNATIQGNRIGVNLGATAALPNIRDGIRLEASSGTRVGGAGGGNIIAHNGSDGVSFLGGGLGNAVLSNSIYANGALGIDLGDDGADFPQDGKGFLALHRGQNFPIITSVTLVAGGTEIRGFMKNEYGPKDVLVQLFASTTADSSGFGEGQTFLGEVTISVPANTVGGFTTLVGPLPAGQAVITATATVTGDGTSEFSPPFNPTVYSVTNTANSGPGSLRDAINAANAHVGADRIEFNIPASDAGHVYYANDNVAGQITLANVTPTTAVSDADISNIDPDWPHSWFSIAPTAALPAISDSLTIDGYTQGRGTESSDDDAKVNTNTVVSKLGLNTVLRVELTGKNAGSLPTGILEGTAGGIAVRGLAINRFQGYGLFLGFQTGGNLFAGNFLGTDISGTRAFTPAVAMDALAIASLAEDVVGGTTAAARNLISGNTGPSFQVAGIFSNGGDRIEGNLIGTDRTGTRALANARGIYTGGAGSTIVGGSDPNATNIISGNINKGVEPRENTIVQNNFIGTDVSGTLPLGNGTGIETGSSSSLITNNRVQIAENRVAFNGVGIRVSNNGNLITRNSIFANSGLGIEFDFNEYVANDVPPASDPPDQDTGPNALQNHPVLTSVTNLAPGTRIQGTLTSTPSSNFRLEFFANADREEAVFVPGALPGQLGEGQTYIGSLDVTTNASGVFDFFVDLPVNLLTLPGADGQWLVTATATNITPVSGSPLNNTSQFSPIASLGGPSVIVTNTGGGIGSLREAIFNSNLTPDRQIIAFAIPATDPRHFYYKDDGVAGKVTLANVATTTAATDAAIPTTGQDAIDPDWPHSWFSIRPTRELPEILDNALIDGYSQSGASENTLAASQGLNTVLKIELDGSAINTAASGLRLGVGAADETALVRVEGLAINRWLRSGILMSLASSDFISGNFIGTDISGSVDLGNGQNGIFLDQAIGVSIGGTTPRERNLISGNTLGIRISLRGGHNIQGNLIGTDRNGSPLLENNFGIIIDQAALNSIGGNANGAGNIIAVSGNDPIVVVDPTLGLQSLTISATATRLTPVERVELITQCADLRNKHGTATVDYERQLTIPDSASEYSKEKLDQLERAEDEAKANFDACLTRLKNDNDLKGYANRILEGTYLARLSQQSVRGNGIANTIGALAQASSSVLGIDLGDDGVTPNDGDNSATPEFDPDSDDGPNGLQNYPVLTSASTTGVTTVTGTLNSLVSHSFRIEFYSNTVGATYRAGEHYLGSLNVTTDANGNTPPFAFNSPVVVPNGQFITATATLLFDVDSDPQTPLEPIETSEFSAGIAVAPRNPWHNYDKPLDVTKDGRVIAEDVLVIINRINAFGSGAVPGDAVYGVPYFYDTTNDASVAPDDVLKVINAINAGLGGEGEANTDEPSTAPPVDPSRADSWSDLLALIAFDSAQQIAARRGVRR